MSIHPEATVASLVLEQPGRLEVFEKLGIDFCCGGQVPLAVASERAKQPLEAVLELLAAEDRRAAEATAADTTDWTAAPLAELTDHIVQRHHDYLRTQLPRLAQLMDKVVEAHGENHPQLAETSSVLSGLSLELGAHLEKEEQILFPMIKQMEVFGEAGSFHCGTVGAPIGVMEHEHDNAGEALARLRRLTGDYTPPADACTTYRALLSGLADLERDLHLHIHKENNILHPRAKQLEEALNRQSENEA